MHSNGEIFYIDHLISSQYTLFLVEELFGSKSGHSSGHLSSVEKLEEHSDVERAVVGEEDDWLGVRVGEKEAQER